MVLAYREIRGRRAEGRYLEEGALSGNTKQRSREKEKVLSKRGGGNQTVVEMAMSEKTGAGARICRKEQATTALAPRNVPHGNRGC